MRQAISQILFSTFVFSLVFEIIAIFSQSSAIRPNSYLAPLSVTEFDSTSVFSDELGTNSDIYRNQQTRIAAFGTSFTLGADTARSQNWTRLLQNARPHVHVQNFSMIGGWEAFLANIEKAKATGVKYDYVLISLTLTKGKRTKVSKGDHQIFRHSGRFRNDVGFPTSVNLLRQMLSPFKPFSRLSPFTEARAQVRPLVNSKDTVPMDDTNSINDCYGRELARLQCHERFEIEFAKTGRPYHDIYNDTYLVCQAEADRTCGVPARIDFVPDFEIHQTSAYRDQIKILLEIAQPLGGKVVFVSQGLFSQPDSPVFYRMLAKNNPASLGFGSHKNDVAIAMSTRAAWLRAKIRNDEIRQAAIELSVQSNEIQFLDFEKAANSEENVEPLFYDFAHLSPEGHLFYSKFLADRLGL